VVVISLFLTDLIRRAIQENNLDIKLTSLYTDT
jgi:hypothetical protein